MSSNDREVYKQFIPIDKRTIYSKNDGVNYEFISLNNEEFKSKYNFTFEETTPHYVKIEWNLEQLNNDYRKCIPFSTESLNVDYTS